MVDDVAVLVAFAEVVVEPLEMLCVWGRVAEADELDAEVAVAGPLAVLFGDGHDGFVEGGRVEDDVVGGMRVFGDEAEGGEAFGGPFSVGEDVEGCGWLVVAAPFFVDAF